MPQTLRSFFLSRNERRYAKVAFPEGYLPPDMQPGVRSLTDRELRAYEGEIFKSRGKDREARMEDAARRLAVLVAVDLSTKDLIFEDLDVLTLEDIDSLVVSAFYNAGLKHIGWTAGDVEEIVKNSEGTGGDSPP